MVDGAPALMTRVPQQLTWGLNPSVASVFAAAPAELYVLTSTLLPVGWSVETSPGEPAAPVASLSVAETTQPVMSRSNVTT